ncbi:MAG: hypothetical protein JNG90_06415 [Planctomycetaceae bacterium]|nr:hypothetical protein [Planctomycetaceae bacterium]
MSDRNSTRRPPGALLARLLVLATLFLTSAPLAAAQDAEIKRGHHRWGRCRPGSWSRVRIMEEASSPDGSKITSVKTRKTTLLAVDDQGVKVEVETTVEVAGSPVETMPQTLELSFDDLPSSDAAKVQRSVLGPGSVEIEGSPIRSTIQQIEITDAAAKTVIKRFYAADTPPYVLKCETTKTDRQSDAVLAQTTLQVIAREVPYPLAGKLHSISLSEEVHKHPGGSIRRLILQAAEVPGGLIAEATKMLDAEGHIVGRSTLELVEYEEK